MTVNKVSSFFDKSYQTPEFITKKKQQAQKSRRGFLKAAAGMGVISSLPMFSLAKDPLTGIAQPTLAELTKSDPWLTLDATLNQLLPSSETGPSAKDIKATAYLYQVMTVQPTEQEEKDFILKGIGWLNGYANSEKSTSFANLSFDDREELLLGISQSRAGKNWLNTLLGYIFQAMLAPESYGGNPNGVGWQWLSHQPGYPLPQQGQRYFELPTRARVDLISNAAYKQKRTSTANKAHLGTQKA